MYAALRIRRAVGTKLRHQQYLALLGRKLTALGLEVSEVDAGPQSHCLLIEQVLKVRIGATDRPVHDAEPPRDDTLPGLTLIVNFAADRTSEMCRVARSQPERWCGSSAAP
jgi:hypothetical protein